MNANEQVDFLDRVELGEKFEEGRQHIPSKEELDAQAAANNQNVPPQKTPEEIAAEEAAQAAAQQAADDNGGNGDDDGATDDTIIGTLVSALGIKPSVELEDTEEGIINYVKEAAPALAQAHLDSVFEAMPDVKAYMEFRKMGGDPRAFLDTQFPKVSFAEMTFDAENADQHEMIIRASYRNQGLSEEDIESSITQLKAADLLSKQAELNLKALAKHEQTTKENQLALQKKQLEDQERENEKFWQKINHTVTQKNELKGITLPQVEKRAFLDYISKEVKDGKTQEMLDIEAEEATGDVEGQLALSLIRFKKYSIGSLIKREATTQNVKTITDRLRGNEGKGGGSRQVSQQSAEDVDKITNTLFG